MTVDPIVDMLRASQEEETSVTIHLRSDRISGVVVEVNEWAVLLRHGLSRSAIRLGAIDAVTMAPHPEHDVAEVEADVTASLRP